MPRTSLKLYSTDGYANDVTTTINYVNPDATDEQALEFTQALNALTTNTYKETEKTVTTNLDSDPEKQTPTFTVSRNTITSSDWTQGDSGRFKCLSQEIVITYSGDGDFYVKLPTQKLIQTSFYRNKNNTPALQMWYYAEDIPSSVQLAITIGTTETKNYKTAETTLNVTT